MTTTYEPQPCPECRVLKCGNCSGKTYDPQADTEVPCPCAAAGHDVGRHH